MKKYRLPYTSNHGSRGTMTVKTTMDKKSLKKWLKKTYQELTFEVSTNEED